MYKDPVKEVSTETEDLPQIRFSAKRSMSFTDPAAAEHDDMEKLSKIVEGSFEAIASATGLSETEVLHAIKDTHVEMLADVLKDGVNVDVLRESIQEAIKKISLATGLDTEQISDIFTAKRDANLHDIVSRLHDSSQANRTKFGN
jgi:NCAIR mutase (PurE)-related protein